MTGDGPVGREPERVLGWLREVVAEAGGQYAGPAGWPIRDTELAAVAAVEQLRAEDGPRALAEALRVIADRVPMAMDPGAPETRDWWVVPLAHAIRAGGYAIDEGAAPREVLAVLGELARAVRG
ncbi:hypothetical protein [Streptomyces otsuchiensis]|uniref:hypothetical protein n=1 Tax=Streptomyces otsuchiensis TaxID=2681388 RepID=UPI0010324542|nr:hypothetical protein [Streptomyces otsuchiensis]